MAVRTYSMYTNKPIELGLIKAERALVKGKVRLLTAAWGVKEKTLHAATVLKSQEA